MAWYVHASNLTKSDGDKAWWKGSYDPGSEVPVSGIYKCQGCMREITSNAGDPFPPQNHHQHDRTQGTIRWKLIFRTNTNGD
jgi:hypothetical protein